RRQIDEPELCYLIAMRTDDPLDRCRWLLRGMKETDERELSSAKTLAKELLSAAKSTDLAQFDELYKSETKEYGREVLRLVELSRTKDEKRVRELAVRLWNDSWDADAFTRGLLTIEAERFVILRRLNEQKAHELVVQLLEERIWDVLASRERALLVELTAAYAALGRELDARRAWSTTSRITNPESNADNPWSSSDRPGAGGMGGMGGMGGRGGMF
ncbi:MAG: hypothetical protein ACKPEY_15115, partial [Planctomycetota bacterium]